MKISKIKKEYDENGYIVIKKFIKKNLVDTIKDDLQKYIELNKKSFSKRNINVTKNNVINSIHDMGKWKWTKYLQKNKKLNIPVVVATSVAVGFGVGFGTYHFASR